MSQRNVSIEVLLDDSGALSHMAEEIVEGLRQSPKILPSKYFYDERGSELFERITTLPEYYPTRTEQWLLERYAGEIAAESPPQELVELGSGAAKKTRLLLDACLAQGRLERFVPLEVSLEMAEAAAAALANDYPQIEIHAVVGDFESHMDEVPEGRARLIAFLGGTIGNFERADAVDLLHDIADLMDGDSRLLLGTDLVKERSVLQAAYNDGQGVTAEFNLNILDVLNRQLDADFDRRAFEHVAFFNEQHSRIEMHLRSLRDQTVRIGDADIEARFAAGELMRTEVSHKYTRPSVEAMLGEAGLRLERWYTDPQEYFGLSLSSRA